MNHPELAPCTPCFPPFPCYPVTGSCWTDPSPTTSDTMRAGCICTGSGRFTHIEPHRTFSPYILTEIARYIDLFYTSSGWFDWTEPTLTTSLQEIEGVQSAISTRSMRFKHIEPHRTFSSYTGTPYHLIVKTTYNFVNNNKQPYVMKLVYSIYFFITSFD